MKNTTLSLMMIASFSLAGSAFAATESAGMASFQWQGKVPAATSSNAGYWLVTADGTQQITGTLRGVMDFENNAGVINLVDSQQLSFKVVKDAVKDGNPFDAAVDNEGVETTLSLVSVAVDQNGMLNEGDDHEYFGISANGTEIAKATTTIVDANVPARVKVVKKAVTSAVLDLAANDVVQVQAQVAVTATTI
ncbi:hypothetical protein [Vibrio parahaemolyticus]|uniref:hypothetical protein n=1 Tax=Vibrio parahaemolyticus TaxID=670 RepID=UPI0022EA76B2|nr:hypothetical protein [Vibrio parahaemolyticus]